MYSPLECETCTRKIQQWREEHYEAIIGNAKLKSVKYKIIDINSTHCWTSKELVQIENCIFPPSPQSILFLPFSKDIPKDMKNHVSQDGPVQNHIHGVHSRN